MHVQYVYEHRLALFKHNIFIVDAINRKESFWHA